MAVKQSLSDLGVTSLRGLAPMNNLVPPPMENVAEEFGVDQYSVEALEAGFQKVMSLDI